MGSKKRIAILGSTGSIGASALEVVDAHPDRLQVVGLAARANIGRLQEQIARYAPRLVSVADEAAAAELSRRCPGVPIVSAVAGMIEVATHPAVDIVLVGTSGAEALLPLFRAIEAGKRIALASKELLVMAGALVMEAVRRADVTLVPVDSEHSALFQALRGVPVEDIDRLVVTGSGGALWHADPAGDHAVRPEDVLRHPKWSMGPKITVDSATLMNKGLEVIEAHWLFGVPYERIRVVMHPQAAVHGLVELIDGSCLAHLGVCDMRLPIQYAFSYPERWPSRLAPLRLTQAGPLQFAEPDRQRFPCLALALEAARRGGTATAALSAANDVAVEAFLRRRIGFPQIPQILDDVLADHAAQPAPSLEAILAADRWARERAAQAIEGLHAIPGQEVGARRPASEAALAPAVARSPVA